MALPSLSRMAYFYPRPPRGGRPDVPAVCPSIFTISIHALREEGDSCGAYHQSVRHYFYPRPPRGGRPGRSGCGQTCHRFLSTPSARRATKRIRFIEYREGLFLSTPSARRATRVDYEMDKVIQFLSTPSARRATSPARAGAHDRRFLSTPSARRATHRPPQGDQDDGISIHALREEGDGNCNNFAVASSKISIHALREEGDKLRFVVYCERPLFLSTPSARRATLATHKRRQSVQHFYPRPPRGGRPPAFCGLGSALVFLSTPSARRATR